jgi:hypothetical protein
VEYVPAKHQSHLVLRPSAVEALPGRHKLQSASDVLEQR